MLNKFKKITALFFIVFLTMRSFAQFGQMPPFTLEIEAITGITAPGFHSFAFAQSGDKWLIIGGRTNGLHGLNSSDGFPPEFKNDNIYVVDTSTWTFYSASLNQLPKTIADPMRSTNMQYLQDGNYLYMAGGFGYDSTLHFFQTYPTLTAVHVDSMIDAVINALPLAPCVRQVTDTNFAVCGGDLGKIGSTYYLCFGHNFTGRYSDPPTPLWTQQYSNRIKKFGMTDNGVSISLTPFTYLEDTTNFHRRDLNVGNIIKPDGNFALEAYGGVFQKTHNFPYQEPILIDATGATVNFGYQQVMSQYTCATIPIYDSTTQTMYNTFLGGISLYNYNPGPNTVTQDTLVPFISDVTTMTTPPSGTISERVMPLQLPGLLGSNAKFVLNENVAYYSNEVIKFRSLPNTRTLLGYMLGGIRASLANFGGSVSNDTIYRIYITPDLTVNIDGSADVIKDAMVYPNPSSQNTSIFFSLKKEELIKISIVDIEGKEIQEIANEKMGMGNQKINFTTSKLSNGIYFCKIQSNEGIKILKLMVNN